MPPLLTKSSFTAYLESPLRLWLEKVRPDLLPPKDPALERIFEQGHIVDDFSRGLYPGGVEVQGYNETGYQNTQKAMADRAKVLYQPTAVAKGMSARGDILTLGKNGLWDIREVKGTTEVKPEHVYDVAFQRLCFETAGIGIGRTFLVHLDNTYVRRGAVEVKKLLAEDDITADVLAVMPEVERLIPSARQVFSWPKELTEEHIRAGGDLIKSEVVLKWLNALAPQERERLLRAMNPFNIAKLLDKKIDVTGLSKAFLDSVAHEPPAKRWPYSADTRGISQQLASLEYPLYFYDYETYGPAIPLFDGYRPYQAMPFQFSLAVQDKPGAKLKIHDFLMQDLADPVPQLIEALRRWIGPSGTLISWNASFENTRNQEMASMHPEHTEFLLSMNERTFDLMQIFRKKLFVHPDFRGSASLKQVLPVLIPELSYKTLHIQEGGEASASWPRITSPETPAKEKEQLIKDEIAYCQLDVMAMVKILEFLQKVSKK